jgi:hypothetical protein
MPGMPRFVAFVAAFGLVGGSLTVAAPAEANPLALLRILVGLGARTAVRSSTRSSLARVPRRTPGAADFRTSSSALARQALQGARNSPSSVGTPPEWSSEAAAVGKPTIPALGSEPYASEARAEVSRSDVFVAEALH